MGESVALKAIVAVCDDWGIGRHGGMLLENRADMRHFVACTKGHAVIMGRKTLESFPGGRPLKDRRNIVLTRDVAFSRDGVETVHSVEEALSAVSGEDVAWVLGGAEVYRQLIPSCVEAVVTKNHCIRPADSFFPNLDDDPSWRIAARDDGHVIQAGAGDEGVPFEFVTYERVDAKQSGSSSWIDGAVDLISAVVDAAYDAVS